jgi:hypothetical protein
MRWAEGLAVHLVNAAGPAPLDAPAPVGPIALAVAWEGPVRGELFRPEGGFQPLEAAVGGGRARVVVPRLNGYAAVLLHETGA